MPEHMLGIVRLAVACPAYVPGHHLGKLKSVQRGTASIIAQEP